MFGDSKKEIMLEEKEYEFLIQGLDYKLFKLFQISLICRAIVSTRPGQNITFKGSSQNLLFKFNSFLSLLDNPVMIAVNKIIVTDLRSSVGNL